MKSTSLQAIEKELPGLSTEENLWLIEQLAQRLRKEQSREQFRAAIEAMSVDPQIQEEIRGTKQ